MLRLWREAIPPSVGTAAAQGAPCGGTGSSAHSAAHCSHLTPLEITSASWTGTGGGFGRHAGARETSGAGEQGVGPIVLGKKTEPVRSVGGAVDK